MKEVNSIRQLGLFGICLMFAFCLSTPELQAQQDSLYQTFDYSKRQRYNIAEIKIEGAVNRDRNAIKSIAGFREGESINIPGDDIPNAINSLLRLKLFEDVHENDISESCYYSKSLEDSLNSGFAGFEKMAQEQ